MSDCRDLVQYFCKMLIFKHDKDLCAICLEEKKLPVVLICSHSFCEKCILIYMTYSEIRNKCPLCRTALARKNNKTKWHCLKLLCIILLSIVSVVIALYIIFDED